MDGGAVIGINSTGKRNTTSMAAFHCPWAHAVDRRFLKPSLVVYSLILNYCQNITCVQMFFKNR